MSLSKHICAVLAQLFLTSWLFAQNLGFLPNHGQLYDQNGHQVPNVHYVHRSGPFQTQLRASGFSYEIFNRIDDETTKITRLDLSLKFANTVEPIEFDWKAAHPNAEKLNFINQHGEFYGLHKYQSVSGSSKEGSVVLDFQSKEDGSLKYDLRVSAAHAKDIRLGFPEHPGIILSSMPDGQLCMVLFGDTIIEEIPACFAVGYDGEKTPVSLHWGKVEGKNELQLIGLDSISLENIQELILDPLPILKWATFFGGGGAEYGYGSDADNYGHAYFCGSVNSGSLATSGAFQTSHAGSDDAYYCKVHKDGGSSSKLYSTYLGGQSKDIAYDIKLSDGDILLTGSTRSPFLSKNAKFDSSYSNNDDGFIALFDSSGQLSWFNYLGGGADDIGRGVNFDSSGNILVVGYTASNYISYASSSGSYFCFDTSYNNNGDAYFGKFKPDGSCLFLSYYGGASLDDGYSICSGTKDTIYFVGQTKSSSNISTSNSYNSGDDGFVSKFLPNGKRVASRYFGDSKDDICYSVDYYKPNLFITGITNSSSGIATSGAFRTSINYPLKAYNSVTDAFLSKLNSDLSINWSTYFGGSINDDARAMVIDDFGYIYIVGSTESYNADSAFVQYVEVIATSDAFQDQNEGGWECYVAKFTNDGNRVWGSFFGGNSNDYGYDMSHGKYGDVYFCGWANSPAKSNLAKNGLVIKNAFQTSNAGAPDAYFADLYYCKKFAVITKDTVCLNDTFSLYFTDSAHYLNDSFKSTRWNLDFKKHRFSWSGPKDTIFSTLQTAKHIGRWKDTGLYQLIVTDSFGCRDTAKIRVNYFYPLPIDTILSDTHYCQWDTIKFQATAGPWAKSNYKYYWNSLDSVFFSKTGGDTLRYPAIKDFSDGKYALRVVDQHGCTSYDTVTITLGPTAELSSNSPVCPKDTIELDATGYRLKKVKWLGPNGYSDSGLSVRILNASTSNTGKYTAIVEDSLGCKDTFTIDVGLFQLDSLSISKNDPICAGDTLKLISTLKSGSNKLKFKWTGPQSYSVLTKNAIIPNAQHNQSGTYKLTITDTTSGCAIDTNISVTIRPLPYPNISSNGPVCEGDSFAIESHPYGGSGYGYSYSWTTPKNTNSTDSFIKINPTTRLDSGVYKLTITDANGCKKDTTYVLNLHMLPDVSFVINKDSQCLKNNAFVFTNTSQITSGSVSQYTWKTQGFSDSIQTSKSSLTRNFTAAGKYRVALVATSNYGCVDSNAQYVVVHPEPDINFKITTQDTQCLRGNSFGFDDQTTFGSNTYQRTWYFGDGDTSQSDPTTHTYSQAGTYKVQLKAISPYGCGDSLFKYVRVQANPSAKIWVDDSLQCLTGNSFSLTDTSSIRSGWNLAGRTWQYPVSQSDTTKSLNL
ncbi:MAG: PKD domain-containing protein, partial [Bacteroidetes bacterium]|nr:PKD domain-containing protein [Bacteroidota bacterium]